MSVRESHKVVQKKIDSHLGAIEKWLASVDGKNPTEAIKFINTYLHHLNDSTKKSMYEHITDITETKLIDVNKLNDL